MSSIGGHQRQDSPMVDEMLDGAQMDVTDSEVIYKDTYKYFWITTLFLMVYHLSVVGVFAKICKGFTLVFEISSSSHTVLLTTL